VVDFILVISAMFFYKKACASRIPQPDLRIRPSGRCVMEQVLLLNITYEPLRVINWKKAITLLMLGKVEVVEEYSREVHSVSFTLRLPSVVRLLRLVKRPKTPVKFSRQNIYARDKYRCQYCGKQLPSEELTYDHVIPKYRGGRTEWKNIVTCCIPCNRRKGGRSPKEAKMRLIRKPMRPQWLPAIRITIGYREVPQTWRDYLYWNVELVE
jgi:5-methylcytosine-specific restriction endonuclease McrA